MPFLLPLILVSGIAGSGVPATPASASDNLSVMPGQTLAFDSTKGNCLACHTMKGSDVPSNVGPPLTNIRQRFPDRKALYAIIYNEERRNAETPMPPFGRNLILSPKEINEIIDFLYTQ